MVEPVARSPLQAFGEAFAEVGEQSSGAIAIREVPFTTQLTLRLVPESAAAEAAAMALGGPLPVEPNTAVSYRDHDILWMGPDEWLIVAAQGQRAVLAPTLTAALAGAHAVVVDVSAQRTIVELVGPAAREVLARGCALDLHDSKFGAGRCAQTLLARVQVILQPIVGGDSVRIFVRASFASHLGMWLLDASLEERAGGERSGYEALAVSAS